MRILGIKARQGIKISFFAWLAYGYFSFTTLFLFLVTTVGLSMNMNDYGLTKRFALLGIVIAAVGAMVFIVSKFLAPINMAVKVKRFLKNK